MSLPEKCIVDTNVPKTANLVTQHDTDSDIPKKCVLACVEAIEHTIKTKGLIMDQNGEIFHEYLNQLSSSGQPGVGDKFMKWVVLNRFSLPDSQRVVIKKTGNSYKEFPTHKDLTNFDNSDRKFVAVANAHQDKPPILQATDSKWWGWESALAEVGITVVFLCPDYVKTKYAKKMGS
ncbi:MAG: hypothetical protein H3C47_09065 [Candidatus Cloacimonetes bacterium]|nr:hypothetical protein [Candidatus Cloacimonadota bacterium]